MFCGQCGQSLPDGSKFCYLCGAVVSRSVQADAVPADEDVIVLGPEEDNPGASECSKDYVYNSDAVKIDHVRVAAPIPAYANDGSDYPVLESEASGSDSKAETAPAAKPGSSVGRVLLSLLLSLVLVVFSLAAIIDAGLRCYLYSGSIENYLSGFAASSITLPGMDGQSISLEDFLEDITDGDFETLYGIPAEDAVAFFESDTFHDFLRDTAANYMNYFTKGGKLKNPLSKDMLLDFIEENDDEIYELTGYTFMREIDGKRTDELDLDMLEQTFDNMRWEKFDAKALTDLLGFDPGRISLVFTLGFVICLAAAAFLLAVLICSVNRWRSLGFSFVGISLALSGGSLTIVAGISCLALRILNFTVLQGLLNPLILNILLFSGPTFAAGLLLAIISSSVRSRKKTKK